MSVEGTAVTPAEQPVIVTVQTSWRATELLLAMYVRDAFAIASPLPAIPTLAPAVALAELMQTRDAGTLTEQWRQWWDSAVSAASFDDVERSDWSVLYGAGDHPALSEALAEVHGRAFEWLAPHTREWEKLRLNLWGGHRPHPIVVSEEKFAGEHRPVVRAVVVPAAERFTTQLRDDAFAVSWDLAEDGDAFAEWAAPILTAVMDAEVRRLS